MRIIHSICAALTVATSIALFSSCDKSPTKPALGGWIQDSSGTVQDIHSVWGTGPNSVFAVGGDGTIDHYDGTHWNLQSSATHEYLWSVEGSSDSDVFAVGGKGTILHYDGTSWQTMTSGTLHNLTSVTVIAPDDVYAAGEQATVLHYDGSSWQAVNTGITGGFITRIKAARVQVAPAMSEKTLGIVALTSGGNVWVRFESSWEEKDFGFFPGANGLWILSWQNIYLVHADKVIQAGSKAVTIYTSPGPNGFQGISGSSLTNIYTVGKGMIHFDGDTWSTVSLPSTQDLYDIWLGPYESGFAVGKSGTILRRVQPI